MVQGFAVLKVPNGKVVKARVNFTKIIDSLSITGDFFLYPEEKFGEIEKAFLGIDPGIEEKELVEKVQQAISSAGIQVFGASAESFAQAVLMAIKQGLEEAEAGK